MSHLWVASSAVLGGVGVALGAFGAHLLRPWLPLQKMTIFETAVRYQMLHALALLAVAVLIQAFPGLAPPLRRVAWLMLAGIVFFCGGLYTVALTDVSAVMWAAPLGGLCWIAGWGFLDFAFWRARSARR
jgi:uncharacterized membrane protein YgdD (TMEM256/DUF423 family)